MFKKIASNTFSQILSKVFTAIISIFLISILTNYFSVEIYWLYSKIYNYIWIFVFLADLWLYAIAIREITANKDDSSRIVWNIMTLRVLLGLIILFLAVFIAYFIPWYNSSLALFSIIIASFFTIFQLINSSILALMQANMKIEFSAFSITLSKLLNLLLISLVVFVFFSKKWQIINDDFYYIPFIFIMCVWVVSVIFNTFLNFFYAKRIAKFWFAFDWDYIKHIFKISLPYGLALFLSIVYFKVDVILLSIIEWPSKWDLSIALYSLPMKIIEVIMVIWGFYMTSMLPSLTKAFKNSNLISNEKNTKKYNKNLNNLIMISFRILFSFAICIFVLWVLFRDYLINIIANENYLITDHIFNSSDAFLVVFSIVLFYFISLIFIYCFIASNNQSRLLKINILLTIFNIIWNIILIPKYSFIWAWIVTLLSQILLTFLWYFYTKDLINFHLPIKFILKNILFGIFIFFVWKFILSNFQIWLYFDFIIFGGGLFMVYMWFLYFVLRGIFE